MDNLAHSMFGCIIGAQLAPKAVKADARRLALASIAVVNLPDADVILAAFGQDFYMFNHRGFTHSLLGLTIVVPLSCLIVAKLLNPPLKSRGEKPLSFWSILAFVLAELLIGHFFLDHLTSYGVMYLYPFTYQRFSFPLMFIVDPIFWLLCGVFLWLSFRNQGAALRKVGVWAAIVICGYWVGDLAFKRAAEGKFVEAGAQGEIYSYPAPTAPLAWTLLAEHHAGGETFFSQAVYFFLNPYKPWIEKVPDAYAQGKLCPGWDYGKVGAENFARFASWGEKVVCAPGEQNGQSGCRCYSLKYALVGASVPGFATYWIAKDGSGHFVLSSSFLDMLKTFARFMSTIGGV